MDMRISTLAGSVDSREKTATDLEQALTVAGIGIYNIKYCLVQALFLISAIIEPLGYSYVLPAARCDLNMTDAERGFIASIPYIGIVLTSFPWGYMVDTQGRKRTVIISALGAGIFSALSAFMPNTISFTICKFLSSLCIAGPAAVPFTFIGEITPRSYRDIMLSVTNAFQISGAALVPLIAWAILPLDFRINFGIYDFRPWRLLTIVYSLFLLLGAFLMSFGPESPKYLVAQGKHGEALTVLQTFYAKNKGKSPDDYAVKKLKMPENQEIKRSFFKSLREQSIPLFKPPLLKWMALNGFLLLGVFAVLNGLYVWVPDILNRVITGDNTGLTACAVIAQRLNETSIEDAPCIETIEQITFIVNSVANVSCGFIAIAASSSVKFIGKKALLVIVFFLVGSFCVSVNYVTDDMLFAALLSSLPLAGLTIGPINAYAVEIFPTHLRGMAISLAMMIGRTGSVAGANLAAFLLNTSCETTFFVFGGLLLLCGLLTFLLRTPKETKYEPEENNVTRM